MTESESMVKKMVELMGFDDFRVETKPEEKKGLVFIYDSPAVVKEHLPVLVSGINHVVRMAARKTGEQPVFFDVNNYRQERENLIAELAKAAAKRASSTKENV